MKYYMQALQSYATFSGRSNRSEYWYYVLFNIIFVIIAIVLDSVLSLSFNGTPYGIIYCVYVLGTFLPGLGVAVRRLHDTDRSGWFMLIALIPLIGAIWLLVVMASEGTSGENKYGSDPNGGGVDFDFEIANQ